MVFFESPTRLAASLADMAGAFGADRRVAVCRELTKFYEEVPRGTASELVAWAEARREGRDLRRRRGRGRRAGRVPGCRRQVRELVAAGIRMKDAATEVARHTGHPSRDLYQAALTPAP